MATMINDRDLERALIAQRQATGVDRFDEVWEGVYMMAPMPNSEHQQIVTRLVAVFQEIVGWSGAGEVFAGVNVSDQDGNWKQNYRVPDVAVFLADSQAKDRGTHWYGGPDLAVEVASHEDQSREKIQFYSKVGVRELLLVDRDPWRLELYRMQDQVIERTDKSTVDDNCSLKSDVLPLTFRLVAGSLVAGAPRPQIEVTDVENGKIWSV